jgi:nucleotide-binding universal stress UspA family protein
MTEGAMIAKMLVCLEGSPSSDATTQTAIEIASQRKASLSGIAIIDEPDIRAGAATGIGGSSFKHERDLSLLADARRRADEWLATFVGRCEAAGLLARTLEVVGRPFEVILAEMERHDLTLIGRDANFRFETNSEDRATREKILRHASHPILLVPERASCSQPALGATVLIAYDGGVAATRALTSFAVSGLAESRDIHVASVGDDGDKAWEMAERAAAHLRTLGVQAQVHSIVSALDNAAALIDFARELGAGLMVMGAFARSRMAELFSRSVTRALAEGSPMPIYMQH